MWSAPSQLHTARRLREQRRNQGPVRPETPPNSAQQNPGQAPTWSFMKGHKARAVHACCFGSPPLRVGFSLVGIGPGFSRDLPAKRITASGS